MDLKNIDKITVYELEILRDELKDNLDCILNELALRVLNEMSKEEKEKFLEQYDRKLDTVNKKEQRC